MSDSGILKLKEQQKYWYLKTGSEWGVFDVFIDLMFNPLKPSGNYMHHLF
jgi:hypothetical protein